jgi:hypothetical protein
MISISLLSLLTVWWRGKNSVQEPQFSVDLVPNDQ